MNTQMWKLVTTYCNTSPNYIVCSTISIKELEWVENSGVKHLISLKSVQYFFGLETFKRFFCTKTFRDTFPNIMLYFTCLAWYEMFTSVIYLSILLHSNEIKKQKIILSFQQSYHLYVCNPLITFVLVSIN